MYKELKMGTSPDKKITEPKQIQGLCHSTDGKEKEEFLGRWQSFIKKLEAIEIEVVRKTETGYSLDNRMPSQKVLLTLSEECQNLADEWYGSGKGNLSCFYLFFYRICEKAQITFYPYESLVFKQTDAGKAGLAKVSALIKSADGFVSVLDAGEKERLERKEYRETILYPYLRQGGLWAGGRSAIDNTILPSVVSQGKGMALVQKQGVLKVIMKWYKNIYKKRNPGKEITDWVQLGSVKANLWKMIIQEPLLNFIQRKQKAILGLVSKISQLSAASKQPQAAQLSQAPHASHESHSSQVSTMPQIKEPFQTSQPSPPKIPSPNPESDSPIEDIKYLEELAVKDNGKILIENKIDKEHILFRLLRQYKTPLTEENLTKFYDEWSQLTPVEKDQWLLLTDEALDSSVAETLAGRFAKFAKSNPGEYFTATNRPDKPTIASKAPTTQGLYHWWVMDQGLQKKQLIKFKRTEIEDLSPIRYWPKSWLRRFPLENIIGGKRIIIRPKQSLETSRFRVNQGPYQPAHCLSMASSGLPEGLELHNNPIYNLGIALDPKAAIISNQHCDIEKCLTEAFLLNPKTNLPLPGESHITVGANSYAGSSIKQTQHNQISQGSLADFPIYLHARNVNIAFNNQAGIFELILVGKKPDTFFLKITTDDPRRDEVVACLIELKMQLLETFGGTEKVDFHFHVIPDGKGKFSIIFAPLAPLIKKFDERYKSEVFYNPELELSHRDLGLPVEHIHLANANGVWGLYFDNDKAMIETIRQKGRETLVALWDFTSKRGAFECVADFLKKRFDSGNSVNKTRNV